MKRLFLVLLCLFIPWMVPAVNAVSNPFSNYTPEPVTEIKSSVPTSDQPIESVTSLEGKDPSDNIETEKKQYKTTYVVKSGDTLRDIAQKFLGDRNLFWKIVVVNYDKFPSLLNNPELVLEGWELTIPDKVDADADKADADKADENLVEKPIVKELTVQEKTDKLQKAVDNLNIRLIAEGLTIVELNSKSVRLMIEKGSITEEEWMNLNPPEGFRWVIEQSKVKLIGRDGKPITNEQISATK